MPRGFKRDNLLTEAAYVGGALTDSKKRSFISLPKNGQPHMVLYGREDNWVQRRRLFDREESKCQKCRKLVLWEGEFWERGEWSHIKDGAGEKCDCLHNAELLCNRCHQGPESKHYQRRPWSKVGA